MTQSNRKERLLYYLIWVIGLLIVLIIRFYPRPGNVVLGTPPVVDLGSGLSEMFSSAVISGPSIGRYPVELTLLAEYRRRMDGKPREVTLGYDLMGVSSILYQGSAPCSLSPDRDTAAVELPNPYRISAHSIRLHLAQ